MHALPFHRHTHRPANTAMVTYPTPQAGLAQPIYSVTIHLPVYSSRANQYIANTAHADEQNTRGTTAPSRVGVVT